MKHAYFLEGIDPKLDLSRGIVVSLSPEVSYGLEKKGIPFRILRRNDEEARMRQEDDSFFLAQIQWVRQFDRYLQAHVPVLKEHSIGAAYHHFSKLKFVMDTLLVYALEILFFFEAHEVDSLTYVSAANAGQQSDFSIFELRRNGRQAFEEILKLLCREKNIRLEIRYSKNEIMAPAGSSPGSNQKTKRFLKKLGIKHWFNFFKYNKWNAPVYSSGSAAPAVLFLDAGSEKIDYVLKKFLRKGMRVFVLIGKDIFQYSGLHEWCVHTLSCKGDGLQTLKPNLSNAAGGLSREHWLFAPFLRKTALNLAPVFLPYLRHFVERIIPEVVSDYLSFQDFCSAYGVGLMIAQGSSGKQYPAALNLAKNSSGIRSLCIQHSCGPTFWLDWTYGELDYFHFFMTTDDLHESFFQKMSREPWISECEVLQSPFYLKGLSRKFSPLRRNPEAPILYIPRKQSVRISKFNSYLYPLPWLYEIQKAIIDVLGRSEAPVIYKHHPASKWAVESIHAYIRDKGFGNITIQEGDLESFLAKAGRVFMDYPSTPLFEAAAAGLPILAIYPSVDRMIAEMRDFFGPSLRSFSCAREAAARLDEFLKEAPEKFIRPLSYASEDALDLIFEKLLVSS